MSYHKLKVYIVLEIYILLLRIKNFNLNRNNYSYKPKNQTIFILMNKQISIRTLNKKYHLYSTEYISYVYYCFKIDKSNHDLNNLFVNNQNNYGIVDYNITVILSQLLKRIVNTALSAYDLLKLNHYSSLLEYTKYCKKEKIQKITIYLLALLLSVKNNYIHVIQSNTYISKLNYNESIILYNNIGISILHISEILQQNHINSMGSISYITYGSYDKFIYIYLLKQLNIVNFTYLDNAILDNLKYVIDHNYHYSFNINTNNKSRYTNLTFIKDIVESTNLNTNIFPTHLNSINKKLIEINSHIWYRIEYLYFNLLKYKINSMIFSHNFYYFKIILDFLKVKQLNLFKIDRHELYNLYSDPRYYLNHNEKPSKLLSNLMINQSNNTSTRRLVDINILEYLKMYKNLYTVSTNTNTNSYNFSTNYFIIHRQNISKYIKTNIKLVIIPEITKYKLILEKYYMYYIFRRQPLFLILNNLQILLNIKQNGLLLINQNNTSLVDVANNPMYHLINCKLGLIVINRFKEKPLVKNEQINHFIDKLPYKLNQSTGHNRIREEIFSKMLGGLFMLCHIDDLEITKKVLLKPDIVENNYFKNSLLLIHNKDYNSNSINIGKLSNSFIVDYITNTVQQLSYQSNIQINIINNYIEYKLKLLYNLDILLKAISKLHSNLMSSVQTSIISIEYIAIIYIINEHRKQESYLNIPIVIDLLFIINIHLSYQLFYEKQHKLCITLIIKIMYLLIHIKNYKLMHIFKDISNKHIIIYNFITNKYKLKYLYLWNMHLNYSNNQYLSANRNLKYITNYIYNFHHLRNYVRDVTITYVTIVNRINHKGE